jgi:four helix bundle protein
MPKSFYMATVNRFEELEIWQLARKLYSNISLIADRLRQKKEFRFAEQMKSAAGSVMDNIAEGFERSSRLEFLNSQGISKGECGELKSQLYRCLDDKYISEAEFSDLYRETDILAKKIAAFITYLNSTQIKGLKFKDRQK